MRSRLLFYSVALISLLVLGTCGGEPSETSGNDAVAEADPSERPAESTGEAAASGFIEILVDGETRRFEHLPPEDNELTAGGLEIHAQTSPEDEHGVWIQLQRRGLAEMEFPHHFDFFDYSTVGEGVTPHRMQLVYEGPTGYAYALQRSEEEGTETGFRIDRLDGRSIEGVILPGTYEVSPFEPPVRIEGGRFQIRLASGA